MHPVREGSLIKPIQDKYDVFFINYDGLSRPGRFRTIVEALAKDNVVILDESHLASGDSNRGEFVSQILGDASNVLYMSATYAKRPETTPLYFRTALGKAGMAMSDLITAVKNGGTALQQILAKILGDKGQLVRRELDFTGINFPLSVDRENKARDYARANEATSILREIIDFDHDKDAHIAQLDKEAKAEGRRVTGQRHTSASVTYQNFTNVVHNYINALLMSMKVDRATDMAIQSLKAGEKPLINLMNTMENLVDWIMAKEGLSKGSPIDAKFNHVLLKALDGTLRATETDAQGNVTHLTIDPYEAGIGERYDEIRSMINAMTGDLPASPIDYMLAKIRKAGFTIDEITGREWIIDYSDEQHPVIAHRSSKERSNRNKPVIEFNDGTTQAMIFNAAGSTGLSLHTDPKFVTRDDIRHMFILQAHLNIDTFIQALGRINRKGQVKLPKYTLLMTALPAEVRPTAILMRKLASLNANTSADTESLQTIKEVPNMMNSYGDAVAAQYLGERQDLARLIGVNPTDGIGKITGRAALIDAEVQEEFYRELEERYKEHLEYLDQIGENKLTAKSYDYRAESEWKTKIYEGHNEEDPLTSSAYLERMKVKMLKKPFTAKKVVEKIETALKGKEPAQYNADLISKITKLTGDYIKLFEQRFKDPQIRRTQTAATNTAFENMKAQLNKFKIGTPYVVNVTEGYDVLGTLIDIRYMDPGEKGNPTAGGRLKFTFAVTDPIQTISYTLTRADNLGKTSEFRPSRDLSLRQEGDTIYMTQWQNHWLTRQMMQEMGAAYDPLKAVFTLPASRLDELNALADRKGVHLFTEGAGHEGTLKAIDWDNQLSKDVTETRHIVTGNILRGVEILQSMGEIINYTDKNGDLQSGILIPRSARDIEKKFTTISVGTDGVMKKIAKLGRYAPTFNFPSSNSKINFSYEGDMLRIGVPKGKKTGGDYYLDSELLKLVDGNNFITRGKFMVGVVRGMEKIKAALKRFETEHNQKFVLPKEKGDVAMQVRDFTEQEQQRPLTSEDVTSLVNKDMKLPLLAQIERSLPDMSTKAKESAKKIVDNEGKKSREEGRKISEECAGKSRPGRKPLNEFERK
jgi:hypothetical protein